MDTFIGIWKSHFAPWLDPLWDSAFFWTTVGLTLASAVAAGVAVALWQRERVNAWFRRDRSREHDAKLFAESDAVMNEPTLDYLLGTLSGDHSFWHKDMEAADRFRRFFGEAGHTYLDPRVRGASRQLRGSIADLIVFTARGLEGPRLL